MFRKGGGKGAVHLRDGKRQRGMTDRRSVCDDRGAAPVIRTSQERAATLTGMS